MRTILVLALLLAVMVSPAFAAGNLTINSTSLAPTFINTRNLTNMLNLTFNSTFGGTNLTALNVTISGNATIGNVSSISAINSTGAVIATTSTNISSTKFTISITGGLNVTTSSTASFIIAVNMTANATVLSNLSVQINEAEFIADTGTNISLASGSSNSSFSQIQDVHASASISPRVVDTNVINQTLVYTITPTGANTINRTVINLPASYQIVNLVNITASGSSCLSSLCNQYTFNSTQITVNFSTPFVNTTANTPIIINFTVNTSSTSTSGIFTSTISGSNITDVITDVVNNQTNVTTKQILNVTNIGVMKTVAIVNGSDYWEFNYSISFSDTVSGILQFRMTNWSSTDSYSIALSNTTTSFATLRSSPDFNTTSKLNITNEYNMTQSLQYTNVSGAITLFLRMIIPTGTQISQSWFTTYGMLFRASA
ncbi:hypothetical protein HYZ41_01995 [archaeon]|nr:hypothetical protein [archaeon]